jgi:plasmid stabilization system protein ParE
MINSNFKIIYSKHAQKELQDAVKWYNKQKKGLGKELKVEVKKIVENILLNPNFASIKYDNTHVAACKIFPYSLHYEIDLNENLIRVISIFHNKRKPSWE